MTQDPIDAFVNNYIANKSSGSSGLTLKYHNDGTAWWVDSKGNDVRADPQYDDYTKAAGYRAPSNSVGVTVQTQPTSTTAALTLDDIKSQVGDAGGKLDNFGGVWVATFRDGSTTTYDPTSFPREGKTTYNPTHNPAPAAKDANAGLTPVERTIAARNSGFDRNNAAINGANNPAAGSQPGNAAPLTPNAAPTAGNNGAGYNFGLTNDNAYNSANTTRNYGQDFNTGAPILSSINIPQPNGNGFMTAPATYSYVQPILGAMGLHTEKPGLVSENDIGAMLGAMNDRSLAMAQHPNLSPAEIQHGFEALSGNISGGSGLNQNYDQSGRLAYGSLKGYRSDATGRPLSGADQGGISTADLLSLLQANPGNDPYSTLDTLGGIPDNGQGQQFASGGTILSTGTQPGRNGNYTSADMNPSYNSQGPNEDINYGGLARSGGGSPDVSAVGMSGLPTQFTRVGEYLPNSSEFWSNASIPNNGAYASRQDEMWDQSNIRDQLKAQRDWLANHPTLSIEDLQNLLQFGTTFNPNVGGAHYGYTGAFPLPPQGDTYPSGTPAPPHSPNPSNAYSAIGQFALRSGKGMAAGGNLMLNEPSHVVGDMTGTPYASLAEPDPLTGAPRPEALSVTPTVPPAQPSTPNAFAQLMQTLFAPPKGRNRPRPLTPIGSPV